MQIHSAVILLIGLPATLLPIFADEAQIASGPFFCSLTAAFQIGYFSLECDISFVENPVLLVLLRHRNTQIARLAITVTGEP